MYVVTPTGIDMCAKKSRLTVQPFHPPGMSNWKVMEKGHCLGVFSPWALGQYLGRTCGTLGSGLVVTDSHNKELIFTRASKVPRANVRAIECEVLLLYARFAPRLQVFRLISTRSWRS